MKNTCVERWMSRLNAVVTRKRALAVGAAMLTARAPGGFADNAAAGPNAKRKCRHRGGQFLARGTCHCVSKQPCAGDQDMFLCSHGVCQCYRNAEGEGFCGQGSAKSSGCSASAECNDGAQCVVSLDCPGGACTTKTDCQSNEGCVNGACQISFCVSACTP